MTTATPTKQCVHYRVDLEWIGDEQHRPRFWTDGKLSMRMGFTPRHGQTNEDHAIESVRNTWHKHEAKVIAVTETDLIGEPIS